jgi:hypothetical protein
MGKFRELQQKSIADAADKVGETISREATKSGGDIGRALRADWDTAKEVMETQRNDLYNPLMSKYGKKKYDIRNTDLLAAAKAFDKELDSIRKFVPAEKLVAVEKAIEAFSKAGQRVVDPVSGQMKGQLPYKATIKELHIARSNLGKIIGKLSSVDSTGFTTGVAKRLYGALDDEMDNALRAVGGDAAVGRYHQAGQAAMEVAQTFKSRALRKIIRDVPPEKLHLAIPKLSVDDMAVLKRITKPKTWADMGKRVWLDVFEAGMGNKDLPLSSAIESRIYGAVDALGAVAAETGDKVFKSGRATEALRSKLGGVLDSDKIALLFSDETRAAQKLLLDAADQVKLNNPRNLGGLLINGALYGSTAKAAYSLDPGAALGAAGITAATNVLARTMTNPKAVKAATMLVKAAHTGKGITVDNPAYVYWSTQYGKEFWSAAREEGVEDTLREAQESAAAQ